MKRHTPISICLFTSFLLALLSTNSSGQEFWLDSNGPFGSDMQVVFAASSGTILAGNQDGMFRSTNKGASWSKVYSRATYAIVESDKRFFAATFGGVISSTNDGQSWSNQLNSQAFSVGLTDDGVIAGGWFGQLWRTTNNGNTWSLTNQSMTNIGFDKFVTDVASVGEVIVYSHFLDGLIRSGDRGSTWEKTAVGFTKFLDRVGDVMVTGEGGLSTSTNGTTWRRLTSTPFDVEAIAFLNGVYAIGSSFGGVAFTGPGNFNWTKVNDGLLHTEAHGVAIDIDGFLYAATDCCVQRSSEPIVATKPPTAVDLLTPADGAEEVVQPTTLSWSQASTVAAYDLQVSDLMDFSTVAVDESSLTDTTYEINGLGPGKKYYWRARGVNEAGPGLWSNTSSFVLRSLAMAPQLTEPIDGSIDLVQPILLSWSVVDSVDSYDLEIASDSEMTQQEMFEEGLLDTTFLAGGLAEGQNHFWRVRSSDIVGSGPWSQTFSFSLLALPAAPLLVRPADGSSGEQAFTVFEWHEVESASLYHMQVDPDSQFTSAVIDDSTLTSTSYTPQSPLAYSATYFWRVRAGASSRSSSGKTTAFGPWSNVRSFTVAVGTAAEDDRGGIPTSYALHANYPNPFNPTTTIQIDLPETSVLTLAVYDLLGHVVLRLESGRVRAGRHRYSVDASGLPSGVYLYRLETPASRNPGG